MFRRLILGLALALALAPAALAASAPSEVAYVLRPVIEAGALKALRVEMRLRGDASGATRLALPGDPCPGAEQMRGLSAAGASLAKDGEEHVLLRHAPGAALTVSYDLVSAYDGLPQNQPRRPLLMADWFAVHGSCAFVTPEGRSAALATVRWTGLPPAWQAFSDIAANARVDILADRYLVGGVGLGGDRPGGGTGALADDLSARRMEGQPGAGRAGHGPGAEGGLRLLGRPAARLPGPRDPCGGRQRLGGARHRRWLRDLLRRAAVDLRGFRTRTFTGTSTSIRGFPARSAASRLPTPTWRPG